jgi:hypothetical protein
VVRQPTLQVRCLSSSLADGPRHLRVARPQGLERAGGERSHVLLAALAHLLHKVIGIKGGEVAWFLSRLIYAELDAHHLLRLRGGEWKHAFGEEETEIFLQSGVLSNAGF